jgi:hypothetical protein
VAAAHGPTALQRRPRGPGGRLGAEAVTPLKRVPQRDWVKYRCPLCGLSVTVPAGIEVDTCAHRDTKKEAHKPRVMKVVK